MAEDRNPTGTSDQRSAAADGQPEQSFGGVAALSQANALLSSLHDVVRSMTTPLSVEELIPSLRSQLGEVFRPDTIVLLSGDPASGRMGVVHAEGARIAASVETIELPVDRVAGRCCGRTSPASRRSVQPRRPARTRGCSAVVARPGCWRWSAMMTKSCTRRLPRR
jgi:hypothetical protein